MSTDIFVERRSLGSSEDVHERKEIHRLSVICLIASRGARFDRRGGGLRLRENPTRGVDADVLGATQRRPRVTNSGRYLAEKPVRKKQGGFIGAILGLFKEGFVAKRGEVRGHG
jgi:hypothetical protein